jgi:uncharacterized membrane protein
MLKDEIADAKRSVNTDRVQITIGEVATMYASGELDILPDFQRLFRWENSKKSKFIESILIGIPVPPAFVYEKEDGTWELVDGLQRISTVLEFMGVLKDPDTGELKRSQLSKTTYLPSLEGIVWEAREQAEESLDKALQLFFRRHRIEFQILKHPSEPNTKYDLFQRLNRGGAYANEQEVRTCSMVLANAEFTNRLRQFSARDDFGKILPVTNEQKQKQKNLEYAVRLVDHTYEDFPQKKEKEVQEFLDETILKIMGERDVEAVLRDVNWTVETLYRLFGETALIPPEERLQGIARRFSLRALEGIAVGLARNRDAILATEDPDKFVRERVAEFWKQSWLRLSEHIPANDKWSVCRVQAAAICDSRLK